MNIDLLFFESSFNKKEDFINNQEKFEEYISTHSFQGKSKELLFLPPSMSINNNKTLLIGCEEISSNKEINIEICNKEWLEKNNFGGVLGVAQGSVRDPYFLIGQYNPDAKVQVALIGKGVLFDSGGLSLKSPS